MFKQFFSMFVFFVFVSLVGCASSMQEAKVPALECEDSSEIPALIEEVSKWKDQSYDSQVKQDVIACIGKIGSEPAVVALTKIQELGYSSWAIEALGETRHPTAIPVLGKLMLNEYSRSEAAKALQRFNQKVLWSAMEPEWLIYKKYGSDGSHDLLKLADHSAAVPVILSLLEKGHDDPVAINALTRLADPSVAVSALIRLLGKSPNCRWSGCTWPKTAIESLGNLGDPSAISTLTKVIYDDRGDEYCKRRTCCSKEKCTMHYPYTEHSLDAIVQIDKLAAIQIMEKVLNEVTTPGKRAIAARKLGAIGGHPQSLLLMSLLRTDGDKEVRVASAAGLGIMKDRSTIGALERAVRHDWERAVQMAAIQALGKVSQGEAPAVLVQVLLSKKSSEKKRNAAAMSLGEIRDPDSVEDFDKALRANQYHSVRREVVRSLGKIGNEEAIMLLSDTFRFKRTKLRLTIVAALQPLGSAALSVLEDRLKVEPTPTVKEALQEAIHAIRDGKTT